MGLKWLFFFPTRCLLLGYETHGSLEMVSKIQMKVVGIFHMIFGAHMDVLFSMKVKIFVLVKWSNRFLQLCRLLRVEGLSCLSRESDFF